MNASMNDTHNLGRLLDLVDAHRSSLNLLPLAWKLAYVLRGWADISLLKTVSSL